MKLRDRAPDLWGDEGASSRKRGRIVKRKTIQQSIKHWRGLSVAELKPSDYQPTKAEKEEEVDMPGASLETVRRAFFRPLTRRMTKGD